jgi:hypothetical protein
MKWMASHLLGTFILAGLIINAVCNLVVIGIFVWWVLAA